MPESRICIGTVFSVNPARRELRVEPAPGRQRAFRALAWVRVAPTQGPEMRCKVEATQVASGGVMVRLAPGVTRDAVSAMRGAKVQVRPDELKARETGDFDLADLLGLSIVEEQGPALGTVVEVYATAANDVIEVGRPDGSTFLLPLIEQVLAQVDWEHGVMLVKNIAPYVVDDAD